ncbi:MAG: glycosylase [Christensenellaceae bacterium]|jgi:maltose alpha-D-glucosyltransferase/alpha-amylase|nr:glycosylase [Christensenellaceae bacterium]
MKHEWLESAVFYQVYPTSFKDSNGDGIGDIQGIISKLDYIKDLGVNAIWLSPCFCSPFGDGGYDITDYYKVDPRFGTNEDLITFFEEAKKLGIYVLLDLVLGHTSIEHPAFKESQKDEKNEFSDMFIWKPGEEPFNNKDNKFLSGIAERPDMFMINYYAIQPAINYGFYKRKAKWQDSPDDEAPKKNLQRLIDICEFWLGLGCKGFRVDMAGSMVKSDPKGVGNIEFWNKAISAVKKKYPESIFLSEWYSPVNSVKKSSFDIDFSSEYFLYMVWTKRGFDYTNRSCYLGDKSGYYTLAIKRFKRMRRVVKNKGYNAVALGNHDKIRMSYGRDHDISKVTFAFHLLAPHLPFVYYGDEIGIPYMKIKSKDGGYRRTGSRTPMQWDNTKNRGFSSSDEIYLPVDKTDCISVKSQADDENSLLTTVKALIKLKRTMKCFRIDSGFKIIKSNNGGNPLVFKRYSNSDEAFVILFPKDEKHTLKLNFIKNIDQFKIISNNLIIKDRIIESKGKAFAVLYKDNP